MLFEPIEIMPLPPDNLDQERWEKACMTNYASTAARKMMCANYASISGKSPKLKINSLSQKYRKSDHGIPAEHQTREIRPGLI